MFMIKKLLNDDIYPSCAYCQFGTKFIKQETVLCVKFGVVDSFGSCKKFKYNPFKRIPKTHKNLNNFNVTDFII